MQRKYRRSQRLRRLLAIGGGLAVAASMPCVAHAASSISAYDAADFRIWAYIPYWASQTQINNFATNGMYTHVSDVLYFGGLRPNATGNLTWADSSYLTEFNTLRSQMQTNGFKLHLSMFEVTGGTTDPTWQSIIASATNRANFVNQLSTIMQGS